MIGLVDLLVLLAVALAVVGALRRGSGLLAAAATGALAAIVCWLAAAVVLALGPPEWHGAVARSAFSHTVEPPVRAVERLTELVTPGGPGPR